MSQSKLEAIITVHATGEKCWKMLENSFGSASHWIRKWHEFCWSITEQSNAIPKQMQLKTALNVELHPYLPQPELLQFNNNKGIVVTAYSPLGSPDRPVSNKEAEPIVLNNPVLQKIADRHNTTIALVALAWGIKRGTPVLPKAVSENHIRENLEAMNVKLDDDDMKAIENIGIRHRYLKQTWMYKPEEVPEDHWDGEE